MDRLARSQALHGRVRAMVSAYERGASPPEAFDALATDLARFQRDHVAGYARLSAARGVDPSSSSASSWPAVPSDAFKHASVFAFVDAAYVFRTSGTTAFARGVHRMRDAGTYDAAALAAARVTFVRGLPARCPVLVLGPNDPESSLAHMCRLFARELGDGSTPAHFVRGDRGAGELAVDALRTRVSGLAAGVPAIVLATSFALVHLLDALGGAPLPLPPGSRVMQTGGFKGRSREVSAADLRTDVARCFAVSERAVVGEYGMTELSSQFWEASAVDESALMGIYLEPSWARVVPVDPETLAPVPEGAIGIARIEDLANVDSAWAVLTQDRVRRRGAGFELLGRAPGAPPRGCSIAIDEMLARAPR